MAIVRSFGLVLCPITVNNLLAQIGELKPALRLNDSPAIHVKYFADTANRVLTTTIQSQISRGLWIILETSKSFSGLQKRRHSSA
jgi:hypothetical protein